MKKELVAGAQVSKAGKLHGLNKRRQVPVSPILAVNVAAVPQRSPLRYPGGKTWLIPHVREWLRHIRPAPKLLVEPFAGGGIVSLTAVMEDLVDHSLMTELDPDVVAFWRAALRHGPELCRKVQRFQPTRKAVAQLSRRSPAGTLERGFRTLVLNRTRSGGILAPGAALIRQGENGKGVASRWYPKTLVKRLQDVSDHADRISFRKRNGVRLLETLPGTCGRDTAVFVDPPYTAGGKHAGRRLYARAELDHARLFEILARNRINFLMTYDKSDEVLTLIEDHGFCVVQVTTKSARHRENSELIITPRPVF